MNENTDLSKVSRMYLANMTKMTRKAQLIGISFLALYLLSGIWLDFVWQETGLIFAYIFAFVIMEIRLRIDMFRVSKGYFGNNAYEARLLLEFIHNNSEAK